jgi:signal transduction histidine kinase
VKYTPAGGRISLRTTTDADTAVLTVADTGVGIAPEELPHIWERLYRGDKSRSERGLGLGLSLVKAIVEAHGGQVRVASKPRLGTTAELRLTSTPHANSEFGVRNSELVPSSEFGVRK